MSASIAGFGVLWVVKYIFLDKIMFGPHQHTPYDADIEVQEAQIEAIDAHGATAGAPEAPAGVPEA